MEDKLVNEMVEKYRELIQKAYAEGYGNGYLEAGGKGLMDKDGPVEKKENRYNGDVF